MTGRSITTAAPAMTSFTSPTAASSSSIKYWIVSVRLHQHQPSVQLQLHSPRHVTQRKCKLFSGIRHAQLLAAVIPSSDARRACLVHAPSSSSLFSTMLPASTSIASMAATMHQMATMQPLRQATMGTSTSFGDFAISAAATADTMVPIKLHERR